jgi:hypothetical protein
MSEDRHNYSQGEYDQLKGQLSRIELREIERLEEKCGNLAEYDYWDIYREAFKFMEGRSWNIDSLTKLRLSAIYKLKMHLLKRAGELRNIKFQK